MGNLVSPPSNPRILRRAEHRLSRSRISANALKVLYRLNRAGFVSYLVGGAVRDILLGREPKDFDIGTNARPAQVRQLFRNAWVIGRRFRLVLVRFEKEVVEVATFRRSPDPPEMEDGETLDALAPVVEADEFGTPEEDAWRRDFTINGLFYNIADFTVIDYVAGLGDLDAGVIRTIGDARRRFAEDPVRMMRAIEYAARLGFALTAEVEDAISLLHGEIRRAAPARIAYELNESLRSGHAASILRGLDRSGLLGHVLPEARDAAVVSGEVPVSRLLDAADGLRAQGIALAEETLLSLVLLPGFLELIARDEEQGRNGQELERSIHELVDPPALRLALSNHHTHLLRSALFLLARILGPLRSGKLVMRTARHEGFPFAHQLARVLCEANERFRPAVDRFEAAKVRVEAGQSLDGMLAGSAEAQASRGGRPRRRRRGRPGKKGTVAQ